MSKLKAIVIDIAKIKKALDNKKMNYEIVSASIVDDFCNFDYKITSGIGMGATHNVKKMPGIIKDELREAFNKLTIHMAIADEIFKHAGIEINSLKDVAGHEYLNLYSVTGFNMKGGDTAEKIKLNGNKYLSSIAGRAELKLPEIAIDNLSNYAWWNELKEAADEVRYQVALYKEGNYIPVKEDDDDDEEHETQGSFFDGKKAAANDRDDDDDFNEAKV